MTDTQGIRQHYSISYRYLIKHTLVNALKTTFDSGYNRDSEFQNLNVFAEYPLTKVEYPAIYVRYNGGRVTASGVGHEEYFKDGDGIFRKWDHRMFKGSVDFVIFSLSPLDIDLAVDALMEVFSFGRLDTQLAEFFYTIYGTPSDQVQSFVNQLALNTDQITDAGMSVGPVPWGAEDLLMFQTQLSTDVFGGFYNSNLTDELGLVWGVNQFPSAYWEDIDLTYRPDLAWQPALVYTEDLSDSLVTSTAEISASEQFS